MKGVAKVLDFLRVTDDDGRFSLTHAALVVALYCAVRGVQVSWAEWAGVVVALASYQAKKYLTPAQAEPPAPPQADPATLNRLAALEQQVSAIRTTSTIAGLKR